MNINIDNYNFVINNTESVKINEDILYSKNPFEHTINSENVNLLVDNLKKIIDIFKSNYNYTYIISYLNKYKFITNNELVNLSEKY